MRGSPPKHAPLPPDWISKPLRAMVPDELEDLRAALCRESPPDAALLRAIDGQLARYTARHAAPVPASVSVDEARHGARYGTASPDLRDDPDDDSDDWAWAVDG
jgi:hypothetical protein